MDSCNPRFLDLEYAQTDPPISTNRSLAAAFYGNALSQQQLLSCESQGNTSNNDIFGPANINQALYNRCFYDGCFCEEPLAPQVYQSPAEPQNFFDGLADIDQPVYAEDSIEDLLLGFTTFGSTPMDDIPGLRIEQEMPRPQPQSLHETTQDHIPTLGDGITRIVRRPRASQNRCKQNCAGNFIGQHRCFRDGKSLIISCKENNCKSAFKTKNDFNRHYKDVHEHGKAGAQSLLDCPFIGCKRVGMNGFKRRDNLRQHRRSYHGEYIPKVWVRFAPGSNRKTVSKTHRPTAEAGCVGVIKEDTRKAGLG